MGNIYAPLPTGYLVDIFRKKHFVNFKVAAFLIAWSLLFANACTLLHICHAIEGSGTGMLQRYVLVNIRVFHNFRTVSVIKKFHIIMCPILDGYGVMTG
jgi:hypothetical protein